MGSICSQGIKLSGSRQLSAYVDDINIVGENIDIIQRNTKAVLDVIARRLVWRCIQRKLSIC
jgi:hypothetical protein